MHSATGATTLQLFSPLAGLMKLIRLLAATAALVLGNACWAAPSCQSVVYALNATLNPRLADPDALAQTLTTLQQTGHLPDRYVTKRQAQAAGWQSGSSLWRVLPGKAIGGDRFGNRERRLPAGQYQEADLDYRGGKRGARRLIISRDGQRYVTVDHYQTFIQVPPCQ
ncbi:hypothetical protein JCM19000A_29270 [Silvimonas sp. JCM 19000]